VPIAGADVRGGADAYGGGKAMSADGAFGVEHGGAPAAALRAARDPHSLVSTRLTRELIAADARCDLERDDPPARVARLLETALSGLSVALGAILRYHPAPERPQCAAAHGVAPSVVAILEGGSVGESLAQRACVERRVFLLDRASREPLMSALRAEVPEVAAAVVVPLYDRGLPVAALVLGSVDPRPLQASSLRLLAPAFHLLGILLSPARAGAAAVRGDRAADGAEQERYVVEIEELGNLLREARESARASAEQAAAMEAERRAEVETYRARVAELEASASRGDVEGSLRRELESAYAAQGRKVEERERRIAELEQDVRALQDRIATLEDERALVARMPGRAASPGDEDDGAAVSDAELQEMADAAAAALRGQDPNGAGGDEPLDEEIDGAAVSLDAATADGGGARADGDEESTASAQEANGAAAAHHVELPLALHLIDVDPEDRSAVAQAAERVGVDVWLGEGEPPLARLLVAANLFDPACLGAIMSSGGPGVAYGRDPESGTGVEIGTVTWIARPIDATVAVARIREAAPAKGGGIVMISSQLRELAPVRDALTAAGVSASVACDSRQALDLLEIVRRPDALVVDLALDGGQGFAIAAQCRAQSDTRETPLFLLLPKALDPSRLLAAARRAGILAPYAAGDVARVVETALLAR